MMSKTPLTVVGADLLRKELHRLKTVERPAVITAIAEARAQGDLSENAEYDAAKEKQSLSRDVSSSWNSNWAARRSSIRRRWQQMAASCLARPWCWKT